MAKNETALTEQEFERQARREAIEALRQWRVTVGKAEHVVMAHSAALGSGGVLMFYTYVEDGMKCRTMFKVWTGCEEIVGPDGSQSTATN
jgi:hypothetical protein